MHKFFQINAWNVEVIADIGDFGCIRFEFKPLAGTLPAFFRNDRSRIDFGAGDDERIRHGHPLEPLLRADQALKMGDFKYLGYELEFICCRCRKQCFVVLCPLQNGLADRLPFQSSLNTSRVETRSRCATSSSSPFQMVLNTRG